MLLYGHVGLGVGGPGGAKEMGGASGAFMYIVTVLSMLSSMP